MKLRFEDIIYILNHTSTIKEQIIKTEENVKSYLVKCFQYILADSVKQEAILANLFYEDQEFRFQKIMSLLKEICNSFES